MTSEFRVEFSAILKRKDVAANEHLQDLVKCLRDHKMIYTLKSVPASCFLTHKANRGGLLLSPHNVHRNAGRIKACGADLKQLGNALAMELSASGKLREEHVTQNTQLIERASGLLAPVTGHERYVTLGCGHTTAFCKLACIGGKKNLREKPDGCWHRHN